MDVVCSVFVCAEVSMNAQNHPRLRRVECDRDVDVLECRKDAKRPGCTT